MANIAINNYCNLQCPYCFANRYITEEEMQSITMEQLEYILEFLGRSSVGRVGIIGGEPTLHPNFSQIITRVAEFCKEHNTHCSIFSNGIQLHKFARLITDNVTCLVNVNSPEVIGESNWKLLIKSLDRIKLCSGLENINLGVNLYSTLTDYGFIFDLALNYCKDHIRVSYVAPTCSFSKVDKDEYYTNAKQIFLPFVDRAIKEGVRVKLDCNHIPRCYFTEEELQKVDSIVDGFHDYCEPVIDITPEFKATACFGAYELFDLSKFENIHQVERYLRYKKLYPLSESNCTGKCNTCAKHENLSCQGGCLAFANR